MYAKTNKTKKKQLKAYFYGNVAELAHRVGSSIFHDVRIKQKASEGECVSSSLVGGERRIMR